VDDSVAALIEEYLYGNSCLTEASESYKVELISQVEGDVSEVRSASRPLVVLRKKMAQWMGSYADFHVLCLTEDEKARSFYRGCPYVSGSLFEEIRTLAPQNADLDALMHERGAMTDDALLEICSSKSTSALLHVNSLNYLRQEFDDVPLGRDWYFAFMEAMLIWREDTYRRDAGFETYFDGIRAMEFGTYQTMVANAQIENPRQRWEEAFVASRQERPYVPGVAGDRVPRS
jgi:hypothetical protein